MTVKDLKAALMNVPDNLEVMIHQADDEFYYSGLVVAEQREIDFVGDDVKTARDLCFLVSDTF